MLRGTAVNPWDLRPLELLGPGYDVRVLEPPNNGYDASSLALRREPVDLVPIVNGAIESSRTIADRKHQQQQHSAQQHAPIHQPPCRAARSRSQTSRAAPRPPTSAAPQAVRTPPAPTGGPRRPVNARTPPPAQRTP